MLTGGGRDEREFAHADRFDVERQFDRHVTFGYGIHFCLGANLARLEGRIVLDETLARFPEWGVDEDAVEMVRTSTVRSPTPGSPSPSAPYPHRSGTNAGAVHEGVRRGAAGGRAGGTAVAEVGEGVGVEAELVAEDVVGVLADPGDAGLGALGDLRHLHRVALGSAPARRRRRCGALHEHVAGGDVRIGGDLGGAVARAGGEPGVSERGQASSLVVRRPRLDRGPDHVFQVRDPAVALVAKRGSSSHSAADELGERSNWCSRPTWSDEPAVVGLEAVMMT